MTWPMAPPVARIMTDAYISCFSWFTQTFLASKKAMSKSLSVARIMTFRYPNLFTARRAMEITMDVSRIMTFLYSNLFTA